MAIHPFYYSMVVDAVPEHPYKAEILSLTLERLGNIPPDRIIVQCTNRVAEKVRDRLVQRGYLVTVIPPYLDGKHCNKLRQLDVFIQKGFDDSDGVFLLDIDLAVLSPIDIPNEEVIWGKIVDGPNPPLPVLERIFAKASVKIPDVLPCDWNTGETVSTNFNGGLIFVPKALASTLNVKWRKWAEFLYIRPELFDKPTQRQHIDQISFAMALASEDFPFKHLPANYNFPCHSKSVPRTFPRESDVYVLHYHACLDGFGLIDPIFSDAELIDNAVNRVNDEIATNDELMFFEMYKRHLAKEAVKSVPFIKQTPFSRDFLARIRNGAKKRRIILHAGTNKTGTTALQLYLYHNRENLAKNGIWFPETSGDMRQPKHQFLVNFLKSNDVTALVKKLSDIFSEIPDDVHTLVFTTEGIFNHWWDFTVESKSLLRHLSHLVDFQIWLWFREPAEYIASNYCQSLQNPKISDTYCYGEDMSFAEMISNKWFCRHLDYLGILYEMQELVGVDSVKAFLYQQDTIGAFFNALKSNEILTETERLPSDTLKSNLSLREPGVGIQRIINRYNLPIDVQQRAADLALEIDRMIGDRAAKFRLSELEQKLVNRYTVQSWKLLRRQIMGAHDL